MEHIKDRGRGGGWLLLVAVVLHVGLADPPADAQESVPDRLRLRLEPAAQQPGTLLVAAGQPIYARTTLLEFYEQRLYAPAWSADGVLKPAAAELISVVEGAGSHGLHPGDYHLAALEGLLAEDRRDPGVLVDLDLLLSDAFLLYGAHLVSGRVNPETFDPEWVAIRREVPLGPLLRSVVEEGTATVSEALASLLPRQPGYDRLRQALAHYRHLAALGGWPVLPIATETLEPGATDPRVPALRRRLAITGDLRGEASDGEVYDEALVVAVQHFQARHGLGPDGRVGAKTLTALNISAEERVRQIELNLERWRWLPQDLGGRHLRVNIPDFTLQLMDSGQVVLDMRVIVGRAYRRTPVFSDLVRYLVLNPYWDVPTKLAVEDKLPEIRKDPAYLDRLGFKVYEGWGAEQRSIDPAEVDWGKLGKGHFPYRLRQDPGPQNALGQVKFMFPNKFNVYLHDTPSRELFARTDRDQSSGCIRLERPIDLAEMLLRDSPWDRSSLNAALARGQEQMVPLPTPVPVHLLYWTAWAVEPEAGETIPVVHFRNDPYGRDRKLEIALSTIPKPVVASQPGSL